MLLSTIPGLEARKVGAFIVLSNIPAQAYPHFKEEVNYA